MSAERIPTLLYSRTVLVPGLVSIALITAQHRGFATHVTHHVPSSDDPARAALTVHSRCAGRNAY